MGKFNNILINNNIDVFNEYRITDRSYTLAKVSSDNTMLMIGSYSLYTGLYGSYISIASNTSIDITTSEYINMYSNNGINEYAPEVNIRNNNSGYSESKLNVYGDVIARYSYKIGCKISDEEKIFDALSYNVGPEILFVGHTDKTKPGTNLCVQGREVTLSSSRDSNTPDSDIYEGSINIFPSHNLNIISLNKNTFKSSYETNIESSNSYIYSRSYKDNTIIAYTNGNSNPSSITLYGNNAGNYDIGTLPWSGYSKVGDIYIGPKKNLNIYSSMFYLYTTASVRIKSYNDTTIESTNSYIKFEAANGVILGNNNKHYGTTLPSTNNTEGRIFFQIIN